MSISDKLAIIAENQPKVYNAGFEAGKTKFNNTNFIGGTGFHSRESFVNVIDALKYNHDSKTYVSKELVNQHFQNVDCTQYATFNSGEDRGLTITYNGDGTFTFNGTYDGRVYNAFGDVDYYQGSGFTLMNFTLPSDLNGVFHVSLEGIEKGSPVDITFAGEQPWGNGRIYVTPSGICDLQILYQHGASFDNVIVRPSIIYDEWESFIYNRMPDSDFVLI